MKLEPVITQPLFDYSLMIPVNFDNSIGYYSGWSVTNTGKFLSYNLDIPANFTHLRIYEGLIESTNGINWDVVRGCALHFEGYAT